MAKIINFEKERTKKERRTNLYFWDNLDHLKNTYYNYINPQEINDIASQIKESGKFKNRAGLTKEENEHCLYNLIDCVIMARLNKKFISIKSAPGNIIHMRDFEK